MLDVRGCPNHEHKEERHQGPFGWNGPFGDRSHAWQALNKPLKQLPDRGSDRVDDRFQKTHHMLVPKIPSLYFGTVKKDKA